MSWGRGLVEWTEGNRTYLSVVFSWQLQDAFQRAVWYKMQGYEVWAGGPAVKLNPSMMVDVADVEGEINALSRHNPDATFTSRGCIRQCEFCAVPKIEGGLVELDWWEPKPVVCDNNFLACSRHHFDRSIDKLKCIKNVDFNQGLDARLLSKYQAGRLAELDFKCMRLAWDNTKQERQFMRAFELLRSAGIPKAKIRVYVLIGFDDTPEDALYRLQAVKDLGSRPNPMRYQALDSTYRNQHVGDGWTERELKRYMRYWSRLRWLEHVPFEEYRG